LQIFPLNEFLYDQTKELYIHLMQTFYLNLMSLKPRNFLRLSLTQNILIYQNASEKNHYQKISIQYYSKKYNQRIK